MFFVVTKAFLHEKKDWRFQSAKAIFNVKDSSEIKGKNIKKQVGSGEMMAQF